jgi:hypothetical protein
LTKHKDSPLAADAKKRVKALKGQKADKPESEAKKPKTK